MSEQLQAGRHRQAAGEGLHLLLHRLLDLGLGVVMRGDDEVLEDFSVFRLMRPCSACACFIISAKFFI
jgi:hypothetical protein